RPRRSIPLLPSGPGGVFDLASRGADGATMETIRIGGEGGIRTREAAINRLHTFQACSFNHSDTSPSWPGRPRGAPGRQFYAPAGSGTRNPMNRREADAGMAE